MFSDSSAVSLFKARDAGLSISSHQAMSVRSLPVLADCLDRYTLLLPSYTASYFAYVEPEEQATFTIVKRIRYQPASTLLHLHDAAVVALPVSEATVGDCLIVLSDFILSTCTKTLTVERIGVTL